MTAVIVDDGSPWGRFANATFAAHSLCIPVRRDAKVLFAFGVARPSAKSIIAVPTFPDIYLALTRSSLSSRDERPSVCTYALPAIVNHAGSLVHRDVCDANESKGRRKRIVASTFRALSVRGREVSNVRPGTLLRYLAEIRDSSDPPLRTDVANVTGNLSENIS